MASSSDTSSELSVTEHTGVTEVGGSLAPSELALMVMNLTLSNVRFTDIVLHEDRPMRLSTPDGLKVAEEITDPITGEMILKERYIPNRKSMESLLETMDENWRDRILQRAIDVGLTIGGEDRLRLNFYMEGAGKLAGVVRRFPIRVPDLEDIQAPDLLVNMLTQRRGLILNVGQTGAGKSTTCAAILKKLSESWATHIVTIENPIEYIHEDRKASFSQRQVGTAGLQSTALGVEDAMRQAPGVIYVAEIRDRDTAEAVFYAQESGHLVLATIHGRNPIEGLQRLVRFFPTERQARLQALAANLVGVIGQVLVPVTKLRGPEGQMVGGGEDQRIGYRAFYDVISAVQRAGTTNNLHTLISEDRFPELQEALVGGMREGRLSNLSAHFMNSDLVQAVEGGEVLLRDAMSKTFWPSALADKVR